MPVILQLPALGDLVQGRQCLGFDPRGLFQVHMAAFHQCAEGALANVLVVVAAQQVVEHAFAQGTLGELLAVIESFLDAGQAPFAWRAAHVLALVQTGDERAVEVLGGYVAAIRTAPRNWLWLTAVALLADACIALGDHRSAPVLESALRPYGGDTVVVAHGIATLGTVAGRLDALRALIARVADHKEVASTS